MIKSMPIPKKLEHAFEVLNDYAKIGSSIASLLYDFGM